MIKRPLRTLSSILLLGCVGAACSAVADPSGDGEDATGGRGGSSASSSGGGVSTSVGGGESTGTGGATQTTKSAGGAGGQATSTGTGGSGTTATTTGTTTATTSGTTTTNPICKPNGDACGAPQECCSNDCAQGLCFTCGALGTSCSADQDCCSGSSCASGACAVKTELVVNGAPANAPTLFGGADDPGKSPAFVYPSDGVIVPPNMNVLEFQFFPGTNNDLFELSFVAPWLDLKVYFPCTPVGGGCVYTPDATVWKLISEAGRGKDPLSYRLRGTTAGNPATLGTTPPRAISFGQQNIVGGLYYWAAAAGTTMRYEFGVTGQNAETYMNKSIAGATTCVGCHVLSRNGKSIAVGTDIPAPSVYKVFDVASKNKLYQQGTQLGGGANFFSFSPDATQIMTSDGVSTTLRDATTGTAIIDKLIKNGTMPDWSPDGKTLAFASTATPPPVDFGGATGIASGSLQLLPNLGGSWGSPSVLVPFADGLNNYYPTYSPDGAWVLFNRSPSNTNSYDAARTDAEVWVVAGTGGAPIKLAQASTGGDSWPKWTPDVQAYKSGTLIWLTFASYRPYGLRLAQDEQAQLWMTAFDPERAKKGQDPSYPAFWLPFQSLKSGNHIAQWVTKVERKLCQSDADCDVGEKCFGTCRPPTN